MNEAQTLFECHGHIMMDGADFSAARSRHARGPDEAAIRANLAALREAGVVYFRDGGDALGVSAAARTIAGEYGIEYRTPIFAIHRTRRYGRIVGRGFDDLRAYRALIAEAETCGADYIKLMLSGIITFRAYGELSCPGLEAGEIRELVHIAHGEGFRVMAHVNGAETVRAAIAAGTDSIEHGFFMDEDCLCALARSETIWVPTVTAAEAFVGRAGFDPVVCRETVERQLAAVRRGRELGVTVAAGADSGAAFVPHGEGTMREYALLRSAGVSLAQIAEGNEAVRARFHRREDETR